MHPTNEQEALEALKGDDLELAATAEAILWRTWCSSGDSEADRIFRAGVDAMQQAKLAEAEELFSRVIQIRPDFAEGWNKRATVRYLAENYDGAIADCEATLARKPHHFGALSGQGLCHVALGQHREAAALFRRTLAVHPHLDAARRNLRLTLGEAVKGNGH